MEIDWSLVLEYSILFQVVSFGIYIMLLHLDKDYKKTDDDFPARVLSWLLGLVPVLSHMCIAGMFVGIRKEVFPERKDHTDAGIPEKALTLCNAIIEREDFIIRDGALFNKALNVSIGRDTVYLDGHTFNTGFFKNTVRKVVYDRKFDTMIDLYIKKGVG